MVSLIIWSHIIWETCEKPRTIKYSKSPLKKRNFALKTVYVPKDLIAQWLSSCDETKEKLCLRVYQARAKLYFLFCFNDILKFVPQLSILPIYWFDFWLNLAHTFLKLRKLFWEWAVQSNRDSPAKSTLSWFFQGFLSKISLCTQIQYLASLIMKSCFDFFTSKYLTTDWYPMAGGGTLVSGNHIV